MWVKLIRVTSLVMSLDVRAVITRGSLTTVEEIMIVIMKVRVRVRVRVSASCVGNVPNESKSIAKKWHI